MKKLSKNKIIITAAVSVLATIVVFQQTSVAGSKSDEPRSMAWYTANIKIAEAKNKECRSDSSGAELQATSDCVNALQALELRFNVRH
ncbi:MAG: hypothetical protein PHN45_02995 [Methylococcales bacterium]|nr:hypothetical protein [Methylococcales bacterium]MDD5753699.1 hypothetical protein [Methylococcales bacterium]